MRAYRLFAALGVAWLTAAAAAADLEKVDFVAMPAPVTAEELASAYSRARVRLSFDDGSVRSYPLHYHRLFRTRDRVGDSRYAAGQLYDAEGTPLQDPLGEPLVAETPDANTLLVVGGGGADAEAARRLLLLTHYEFDWLLSDGTPSWKAVNWYRRVPMSITLTTLRQRAGDGVLRAVDQRPVDLSAVGGVWFPCAGSRTPWNTHLGGEEDYDLFRRDLVDQAIRGMTDLYFRGRQQAQPYRYGHILEVAVSAGGETSVTKHYSMGRASWEKAEVMPDRRTVYLGDDGAYNGLFMYVADRPGDLSAGTLYAARWEQRSAVAGGTARLHWLRLGHASDREIEAMVSHEVFNGKESSVFDYAPAPLEGYTAVRAGVKATTEYLRLKPGKGLAAAFLESRRYAAYRGATTEFNKMEGIAVDPDGRRLYLAMSAIDHGMTAEDGGPRDDIRLPRLRSGGVYRLELGGDALDTEGTPVLSQWVAASMTGIPALAGVDLSRPDPLGNRADPGRVANPDNLAFSPRMRTLFVGEDSAAHTSNFLWAYNVDSGTLARILSVPAGAETSGLQVLDDVSGHAYILANYQHAGNGLAARRFADRGLQDAVSALVDPFTAEVGYIGGIPGL